MVRMPLVQTFAGPAALVANVLSSASQTRMRGTFPIVLIVCVGAFLLPVHGQPQGAPPKELLEYIKDASKLGLKETQIRDNAVQAGWPVDTVNRALAYSHHEPSSSTGGNELTTSAPTRASAPAASPGTSDAAAKADVSAPRGDAHPAAPTIVESTKAAAGSSEAKDPGRTHGVPDDYVIGAGDVLQISVWKEPDASVPNVVVRPDGKVSLPILKEVDAIGLTPMQLEKVLTEKLSRFIPAADVTVVVTAINSKKIYVLGAVKKEGPIPYTYRMTIMQALSEAGGLNDYAKRKKIYVLRMENGKEYRLPFDYNAALKGEHMELNIPLLPGDTLVIPQ